MANHYRVLQVHPSAELDVIRAAYRALARKHHPDFGGDATIMVAVNSAWHVLSDPESRAAYDAELAKSLRRRSSDGQVPAPISGFAPGTMRSRTTSSADSGSVIDFGRYAGWSVGRLVEHDPDYLEWLARTPIGRRLAAEIEAVLARRATQAESLRPTGTAGRRGRH